MSNTSAIIIHWNTPRELKEQLKLLKPSSDLDVRVIDNGTLKETSQWKDSNPRVKFIFNEGNYGFSRAANQGVLENKADWFLFLNPDCHITPEQVEKMVEYAEKNKLSALSPQTKDSRYTKPLPSAFNLFIEFTPLKLFESFFNKGSKTLTGGCLLISSKSFFEIGGWDERFWLWFEDSDLTKRLKNNSLSYGFYPEEINHKGGTSFNHHSSQQQKDIFFHSMNVYARKHFSWLGQKVISLLKIKYSSRKLLPSLNKGLTITVPNLKLELLQSFLKENDKILDSFFETIIVSSSLNKKNIWDFRNKHPQVRFISLDNNQGFAHTTNIGLRASTSDWLGTINDDVILPNGFIEKITKNLPSTAGAVNPVITNQSGEIESAGISILNIGKALPNKRIHLGESYQIDASNAACVIYKQDALNEVGIFDEKFGSYLEDIDLSLRLTRANWKNILITDLKIIHQKHATSQDFGRYKKWLDAKNWFLVIIKNWSPPNYLSGGVNIFIERLRNIWGIVK